MEEIWKDIAGYEGHYMVSNTGKVYSYKRKKVLSPSTQGYHQVCLCKNGKVRSFHIHRLVAEAFIPNPENKPEVNHIDHNTDNNYADNLEWVTKFENYKAYIRFRIAKKRSKS
jgi:hypothetical protein